MRHTRYTWDDNGCVLYESTWSLLQKFAWFNACNTRDIQREFGTAAKRAHPQNWSDRDRDLHGWGAVDSGLVKQGLGLTDFHVETASILTFMRPDEAKVLACRSLRTCPECVQQGFHTPFHQLLFIAKCPLHECMLTTQCMHCGKPTAPYALVRASFQTPYGCGACGTPWWKGARAGSIASPQEQARFHILDEIGTWLKKRKNDTTIEVELAKLARFMGSDQDFHASVRQLPHRWADVLGAPPPHDIVGGPCNTDLHVMLESAYSPIPAGYGLHVERKDNFVTTYRAIRRYLTRRFLKSHRRCFVKMGKGIWFPAIRRELEARHFCQASYALLLWRMLWEKVEVPQKFFSRQLYLVQPEMDLVPDWIPPAIPQDIARRLFGMECLRTYRRCCELAAQMHHKEKITFPVWRLSSRRLGEWIIQQPKAAQSYKIHWWWPKRWESMLRFEPHRGMTTKRTGQDTYWIAC